MCTYGRSLSNGTEIRLVPIPNGQPSNNAERCWLVWQVMLVDPPVIGPVMVKGGYPDLLLLEG